VCVCLSIPNRLVQALWEDKYNLRKFDYN